MYIFYDLISPSTPSNGVSLLDQTLKASYSLKTRLAFILKGGIHINEVSWFHFLKCYFKTPYYQFRAFLKHDEHDISKSLDGILPDLSPPIWDIKLTFSVCSVKTIKTETIEIDETVGRTH